MTDSIERYAREQIKLETDTELLIRLDKALRRHELYADDRTNELAILELNRRRRRRAKGLPL
jgi:hypothetical protein